MWIGRFAGSLRAARRADRHAAAVDSAARDGVGNRRHAAADPTDTPTPRVSFDIGPYLGPWDLNLRFQFDDGPVIQQIRFVGGFSLRINQDGSVDGQGSLTTAVYHEGCAANVVGDGTIQVRFDGQLRTGASGPELVFSLQPQDIGRRESYLLNCGTFPEPLAFEQQTLWPALQALRAQPYTLPLTPGASIDQTDSLDGRAATYRAA